MELYDSNPNMIYGTVTRVLSKEDKAEMEQIIERIRQIFEADSVCMHIKNMSLNDCDYIININGSKLGQSCNKM